MLVLSDSSSTVCGSIFIGPQCADGRPQLVEGYPGSGIEQAKPDVLFEIENIAQPIQGSGASHKEHPSDIDGKNAGYINNYCTFNLQAYLESSS